MVAISPVTRSSRDKRGFIPVLVKIARDSGVSGYADQGADRWPAGLASSALESLLACPSLPT